jgi:hypothetical protein
MVDICPRDSQSAFLLWSTSSAGAAFFDGPEVVREGRVAEVEVSGGDDGVAEALKRRVELVSQESNGGVRGAYGCSCWPDAVEHVCAEGYSDDQVFGISLNHYISVV